jgi:hypothetical protein
VWIGLSSFGLAIGKSFLTSGGDCSTTPSGNRANQAKPTYELMRSEMCERKGNPVVRSITVYDLGRCRGGMDSIADHGNH